MGGYAEEEGEEEDGGLVPCSEGKDAIAEKEGRRLFLDC